MEQKQIDVMTKKLQNLKRYKKRKEYTVSTKINVDYWVL